MSPVESVAAIPNDLIWRLSILIIEGIEIGAIAVDALLP